MIIKIAFVFNVEHLPRWVHLNGQYKFTSFCCFLSSGRFSSAKGILFKEGGQSEDSEPIPISHPFLKAYLYSTQGEHFHKSLLFPIYL